MISTSIQAHNAVYNVYTAMAEASPFDFEKIEKEPAQDAVYNAPWPPVYVVYRAVHLWWQMMRASAVADDKQHMTEVNDLAGVSIH